MADLSNLRTASLYINNQLLSRGLLRDGRAVNFADPSGRGSQSDDDDAIDNTADTMARVISVINDLILRRDRDAEHRESLSTALRTVRAEHLRQANDLQRALERHADAQRRADIGEASEASLRAQLAAAESTNRKLRDDAAKMRQLVAQTRASCATEVRKRDRQIDGLKKAVTDAGRARGERRSPAITTITIGGTDHLQPPSSRPNFASPRSGHGTPKSQRSGATSAATSATGAVPAPMADSDYDLRSETNAFLAELARGLSDNNEVLLSLVHHTSHQLKTMSGFAADEADNDDKAGSNGSDHSALVADMEAVLDHLRTILTNPSFVPIEEVVQRESEIGRLRDGWEKMEDRWKEAVHLLDGWRHRMVDNGRSVNIEEIKMGLRLSPVRVRSVAETTRGLGLRLPPLHETLGDVEEEVEEEEEEEQEVEEEEDEEEEDDDEDANDARGYPPLGRSPSPAESLRLVPAPRDRRYAEPDGGEDDVDDSASDASSVFYDDDDQGEDDEPNVKIIEQSTLMPSLDPSPATESFSRTPSPSPPPPEKPALSKVTTTAIKETTKAVEQGRQLDTVEPEKTVPAKGEARNDRKVGKPALQPSRTAGNRGGINAPVAVVAPPAAPEAKKDAPAAGVRGRRQPGEVEPSAARPTARPAGPRAAVAAVAARTDSRSRRTAAPAPRSVPSAAPTAKQARPAAAAPAAAAVKPAPSTTASSKPARPVSVVASRPASTTSHASEASAASARSARQDRLLKQQHSFERPAPKATATVSSPARNATTSASRARSRSPLKTVTTNPDGSARLPMPATGVPPASPALNMATIAAKLAASEREADAARVRAKLKAMRSGRSVSAKAKGPVGVSARATEAVASSTTSVTDESVSVDPIKKSVAPVDAEHALATSIGSDKSMDDDQDAADAHVQQTLRKKRGHKDTRRTKRVASRRRSTLNPWELKTLMTGSTGSDADTEQARAP